MRQTEHVFDPATGIITTDEGWVLGPDSTLSQARSTWPTASLRDVRTGWWWLGVSRVTLGGTAFSPDLGFHGEALRMMFLVLTMDDDGRGWDAWTYEHEQERDRRQVAWLEQTIGVAQADPPWGYYGSSYDPKGGFSSIVVRYGPL